MWAHLVAFDLVLLHERIHRLGAVAELVVRFGRVAAFGRFLEGIKHAEVLVKDLHACAQHGTRVLSCEGAVEGWLWRSRSKSSGCGLRPQARREGCAKRRSAEEARKGAGVVVTREVVMAMVGVGVVAMVRVGGAWGRHWWRRVAGRHLEDDVLRDELLEDAFEVDLFVPHLRARKEASKGGTAQPVANPCERRRREGGPVA